MCSPNKGLVAVLWAGLLAAAPNLAAQAPSAELIAQYRQAPSHWPALASDPGVSPQELGPLAKLAHPAWQTEAVEQLGKQLFFDPRLSASGQIACASCHDPQLGWADGRRNGFGAQRQTGRRNTMSILNSAYFSRHFWDGRAEGLAAQALGPIENPVEMNAKLEDVLATLNTIPGYRQQFSRAFGVDTIDAPHLGKAIAAFERTVVSRASKFDHFVKGDYQRLSDQEIHGLHLFRTKARCINCHNGPEFSDDKFHNIGLSYYGRFYQDLGRYDITGQEQDKGKFRTPSLRDIAHTGPYMHNGLFPSLRGVLNMYNAGMTIRNKPKPGGPKLSPHIKPLKLDRHELAALESFLHSISRRPGYVRPPNLPKAAAPIITQATKKL